MLGAQRAHKVCLRNGAKSVTIRKSRSRFLMNCIPGVLVSMPNLLPMRLVSPWMDELHLTPLVLIDHIAALVPLPRTHWHQHRYLCAVLIARIYEVVLLLCPKCAGQMRLITFITEGTQVRRILDYIGVESEPPHIPPGTWPAVVG